MQIGIAATGLLLLLGCAYAIAFCSSGPDVSGHATGADDAFISYRYARNLAEGNGLVFNVGERVEGFTNLFYVLLMTIPFLVHLDVFAFSLVLNTCFAFGTWLLLTRYLRERVGDRAALFGGLLFALSPSIWIWTSSGMETPLVLMLQTAIWVGVENIDGGRHTRRSLPWLCLCIALLVLTRADGFVSGVFAAGYLLVKGRRRAAGVIAATVGSVFGAVLAWRIGYYHEVLPNTYYVKVTSTLVRRLRSAVRELGGISARQGVSVYLLIVAFWLIPRVGPLIKNTRATISGLTFGPVFLLALLSYWIYVGGDNFDNRFLLVFFPIGAFILLEFILRDAKASVSLFVVAVFAAVQLAPIVFLDQFGKTFQPKYDNRVTVGRFLKAHRPGALIATGAAGKIPYFSELRTIDLLGLCDAHIGRMQVTDFVPGHSKHDIDYVLSLKPDLIFVPFAGDGLDVTDTDLSASLPVAKYRGAGYQLHYVVNTGPTSRGDDDIIDVLNRRTEDIILLAHIGWRGAILERNLPEPAL